MVKSWRAIFMTMFFGEKAKSYDLKEKFTGATSGKERETGMVS